MVKLQTLTIPGSILSAWNTLPLPVIPIPPVCKFLEINVNAEYVNTASQAATTAGKASYPANVQFRPTIQLATPIPGIVISTVLNPFGNISASTMTGTFPYNVSYTLVVPMPASMNDGSKSLALMIAPEVYGSSSATNWLFTSFSGTVRAY